MKTKTTWKIILTTCLVLFAITVIYMSISWHKAEAKSKDWVGSWNVEINVVNQNATFPGLVTFFNDGNMLTDEIPSPLETSGHGSWINTRKNQGAYSFVFLMGNTDPTGPWMKGTLYGQVNYDPKADTWNGEFTIQIVDQYGNEILKDVGTMNGTRITDHP